MRLRTLVFLAWRDLTKDLRVLAMVIVAVGSGSLTLVPLRGLLEGLTGNLVATTIDASTGHIILTPLEDRPFLRNLADVQTAVIALPAVVGLSVRLHDRCIVSSGGTSLSVAALGVDPTMEQRTTTIAQTLIAGRFLERGPNDVVVGKEIADTLHLRQDQPADVVFSNGVRQRLRVVGIFSTGMRQIDAQMFLPLRRLQSILHAEGQASEVTVRLSDLELASWYRVRLQRIGLEARIETWQDQLAFVESMRRNYAFIQQFLILMTLVAAGIATGVLIYTNIQHKRRAIGILKAIGAKDRQVLTVFVLQGLAIGTAGALVGAALGGGICYYLSQHPVVLGSSMSSMPLRASLSADLFVLPTLLILLTTMASAWYPAWRASRMGIVDAIWAS